MEDDSSTIQAFLQIHLRLSPLLLWSIFLTYSSTWLKKTLDAVGREMLQGCWVNLKHKYPLKRTFRGKKKKKNMLISVDFD